MKQKQLKTKTNKQTNNNTHTHARTGTKPTGQPKAADTPTSNFYCLTVLRWCFLTWKVGIKQEVEEKEKRIPKRGIEPRPSRWEREILTTRPLGKLPKTVHLNIISFRYGAVPLCGSMHPGCFKMSATIRTTGKIVGWRLLSVQSKYVFHHPASPLNMLPSNL